MALEMPVGKSTGRKRAGKVVDVEERENKKVMKTELKTDVNADVTGPLTPSSWMAVWDCGEGDGIFENYNLGMEDNMRLLCEVFNIETNMEPVSSPLFGFLRLNLIFFGVFPVQPVELTGLILDSTGKFGPVFETPPRCAIRQFDSLT
ncbi:ethylene-responsive transcription factor 5 [Artemisia annua]|uniref:Ethylene-responsive transcription factor 5 n=1 Tax=Artemisia annua TaxID=35608 RepID=A0A2U1N852_ARTAN|nr:ethylene-responsive transcription factor 5 [Artemisia annua]